jgi:hypothetical protein
MLKSRRPWRCIVAASAILLLCALDGAGAASIWERAGPFQACLEQSFDKWLQARAELVLNEDPRAGDVDDAAVAQWTARTVDACRAQAGGSDEESVARFAKHMAHWHTHIYDLVQSIQQRTRPD